MSKSNLIKEMSVQRNRYTVKARYTSLKDAVFAGRYDVISMFITEEFKISVDEVVIENEFVLHHTSRPVSDGDEMVELDRLGLRPATLQELCAFGAKYPDAQREFPVVALGSISLCLRQKHYPCLARWGEGRYLGVLRCPDELEPYYRFLAAPASAKASAGKRT